MIWVRAHSKPSFSANSAQPYHQVSTVVSTLFHCSVLNSIRHSYLEMALNGQLDVETRENLSQSHAASKVSLVSNAGRQSLTHPVEFTVHYQ